MEAELNIMSDDLLIVRARDDAQAFGEIYDKYVAKIYNYVRYRVDSNMVADDLTAKTFQQALFNLDNYDVDKGPFKAWLFGIAHNIVSHYFRDKQKHQLWSDEYLNDSATVEESLENDIIRKELHDRLLCAVSRLKERDRGIIALKFGGGLTNREIAQIMDLHESNIGVILFRSIKRLRGILSE